MLTNKFYQFDTNSFGESLIFAQIKNSSNTQFFRFFEKLAYTLFFIFRMYSNFSPVSSGDQRYEEPSSPLDFEEKAERLIAMQSSHINPVSPDLSSSSPNPCTATQQLHEDNATDSCSINVSTVTLDPANSAS